MTRQPKNAAATYLSRWPKKSDTYKTMRGALDRVARALGASEAEDCKWEKVRFGDARAIAARLADDDLKPRTINKCLSALRGVLETAWRLGQIPDDEYRRIEIRNVAGASLPAGRALDESEVDAILAALGGEVPARAAAIACLAGCGLRRVELMRLRGEDYYDGELHAHGKGNKERAIPVPPRWRPFIDAWWRELPSGTPAFVDLVSRDAVNYLIESFIARHGLKKFTPHDLRRTYITRICERADPLVAQGLAGHANLNTTAIYDRRGKAAQKKAVEDL